MRYSWSYLEDMLVCRIDSRKMAMVLDDLKRVNGKQNQLKDHLIEFFHLPEVEDDTIWENDRNEFLQSIDKIYWCFIPYRTLVSKKESYVRL